MRRGSLELLSRPGLKNFPLLLCLGMPSIGVSSREGPPPILDPKTYASPSARYVLEVDPTDPQGKGAAKYRLLREGRDFWSGERPFTFWDAIVTDNGESIGYAYPQGIRGLGKSDEFVVAILGEKGEVRARHARPLVTTAASCPLGRVSSLGLILQPSADRVVVRLHGDGFGSKDAWWNFRLSDGTELESVDPARSLDQLGEYRMQGGAIALAGTPLVLVHWNSGLRDAVFALLDENQRPVWVRDIPGDYARPSKGAEQSRMWSWIREGKAISGGSSSGQFEIHSILHSTRTRFEATADPESKTGWRIHEIGSEQEPVSFEDPPSPVFPSIRLRELGRAVLASASERPPPPIHDVYAFEFDEEGRFEVIRRPEGADRKFSWCHVDRSGSLLRDAEFPRFGSDEGRFHWLRISSERWLVTQSGFGMGATASAWWADTRSGRVEVIEGFDCPPVKSLVRDPRGGFVVLGESMWEYGMTPILSSFGPDARPRWCLGRERLNDPRVPQEPGSLFSPNAIALTADGSTIVVDTIRKTLQLFDSTGTYVRTISLEESWGEAKYPGYLFATTAGEVFVHDSGGSQSTIWRMDLVGRPATRIDLRYADGHKPLPRGATLRVAPDGRLWTTDGQMLERIGPDGAVDETLGNIPGLDAPTEIEDVFVDSLGRILTLDKRNRIVQVFDREGRALARCQFDATDEIGRNPFTDAGDGSILVSAQDSQYVRFDAEGARLGREKLSAETRSHRCYFQPGTTRRWLRVGYAGGLVDWGNGVEGSGARASIRRRPDGRWLRELLSVVVAKDGTLFVHDGMTVGPPEVPSSISIYPSDGTTGRTIDLPARGFGRDLSVLTGWFAIGTGREMYLVEGDGQRVLRAEFGTPGKKTEWIESFASPDGNEIWLIEPPTRTLVRYALP